MNTRGIVQLVVLNIGVQLKVISPVIFAMFVLMATILTFLTSPILSILYSKVNEKEFSSQPNEINENKENLSRISSSENDFQSKSSSMNPTKDHSIEIQSKTSIEKKHRRMTLF